MTPNLEWLRAFVVFAEHLNFTRAAEALHLSQPALHVQVKKLGEQLEVTLYERRGRALVLTDEGREVLAFGRELLARCERFGQRLRRAPAETPPHLVAGEGALLYLLPLAALVRGGERLRTTVLDGASTVRAIREGRADVGVAALSRPPEDLESAPIAESASVLLVPAGHRLAKRRRVRARDLDGERLVLPPRGRPQREAIDLWLAGADARVEVDVEARGWPLTLRFAALGLGLAIVNDFCPTPRRMRAIVIDGLPRQRYFALRRPGALRTEAQVRVWEVLCP